jgi:antitoxin YefM
MQTINATDVRKDWGRFIDSVVRDKPKLIKRSRDLIFAINFDMLKEILLEDKLRITLMTEDDGSVTGVVEQLDITGNAADEDQLIKELADEVIAYAQDYYEEFSYWYSAPNRREHLPYVLAVLACEPDNVVKELFVCQVGKK